MLTHSHPLDRSNPQSRDGIWHILSTVWAHRATRLTAAAGAAVTSGLAAGLIMPRGPVTSAEALILMALGLLTGIAAGFVMRSRWAMLVAPVVHIAAYELMRLGESGPTVDGIHLDTTFGIMAFVVGRGVYGVLALAPMLLGVIWGNGIATIIAEDTLDRMHRRQRRRHRIGMGFGAASTLALVALAIWIAMPPSVPAILDASGNEIPDSIAELSSVNLGGNDQWIEIRAANPENPILLYISGGPGQSDLALSRAMLQPLEDDFVIILWDQRGNGLSYASFDPATLTLDRVIADTIELTDYLRQRFDEERIYILGESWGTTLAVLTAQQRPDLFHAIIGSGQMVSQRETDRMIYDDLLVWADENDRGLAQQLRDFGPPPYEELWAYGVVMENYPNLEGEYDPPQAAIDRLEAADVGFWGMMGSEYTPIDKTNIFRGLMETFNVLYPQLQGIDFRTDVRSLDVPIYIFDGEHELRGRRDLVFEWFDILQAPDKQIFTFEDGGHSVALEHADDLDRILEEIILPATYPDE